jgi:acetoacetate decarboxylase
VNISRVDLPGYPLGAGSFAVAASYADVEGWYPLVMPMTQERALTGGREVFGEPKKLGEVSVEREGRVVHAGMARHGIGRRGEVVERVGAEALLPYIHQRYDDPRQILDALPEGSA